MTAQPDGRAAEVYLVQDEGAVAEQLERVPRRRREVEARPVDLDAAGVLLERVDPPPGDRRRDRRKRERESGRASERVGGVDAVGESEGTGDEAPDGDGTPE